MTRLASSLDPPGPRRALGLIVLQADVTLEPELARGAPDLMGALHISRIPSAPEVTTSTLSAMRGEITRAASLLPPLPFSAIGYACTSASAVIGADRVADLVRKSCDTRAVTNPLSAVVAWAKDKGITRLAMVSPYVEEVNAPLIVAFGREGIAIGSFGSFGIAAEEEVARITCASVVDAAVSLGGHGSAEAVFLSCTNLRTQEAIPLIEQRLGKPVISSNSALIWHLRRLQEVAHTYAKVSD